jgi:hypothetical protein
MLSNEDGVLTNSVGEKALVYYQYGHTQDPLDRQPYANELLPLSVAGFKPSDYYGITNGASVTLSWLWNLPLASELTNIFEIVWNDTLDNLTPGYTTNLISAVGLSMKGWKLEDLTVTAPTGWVVSVYSDEDGNAWASLARDDAALGTAMENCELIVTNAANGTLAVTATVASGVRGFWYVLYGSDDLTTWEPVTDGTYESGTPAAQAQGTAENPVDKVELSITVTPGDSAAGAKRFYKVVSGATRTPLEE